MPCDKPEIPAELLHSDRAVISASIALQEERINSLHTKRQKNLDQAERHTGDTIDQRYHRERAELVADHVVRFGTMKATVNAEIKAIDRRIETAKGVKKVLRDMFGTTRKEQDKRANLVKSISVVRSLEKRQLRQLENHRALQHKRTKLRAESLRDRARGQATRRKEKLQEVSRRPASPEPIQDLPKPANDGMSPVQKTAPIQKPKPEKVRPVQSTEKPKKQKAKGWDREIKSEWGRATQPSNDNSQKRDGWSRHRGSAPVRGRKPK